MGGFNMNCYSKETVYYFNVDWQTAVSNDVGLYEDTLKYYEGCGVYEFIVKFSYKEHLHYFRYMLNKPYTWVPYLVSNTKPAINLLKNYFIASNLTEELANANALMDIPVIIPDYSSVNVGVGKQWPAKVFAPYVDSTAWPPYSLQNSYNATGGLYYNLGFIVSKSATVCEPTWGTYYSAEAGPLNDQIKAIRDLGGDVTVSFGGAANVPLHIVAPSSQALFEEYKAFTVAYGLTRIDFDLEGTWIASPYNAANINNSNAIKQLQDYYKSIGKTIAVWFTLPILPTGLTPDGLNIIQLALNAGVEIGGINAMTMDYGDYAAPNPQGNMGEYGIQAITALYNQLNVLYNGSKTSAQLWAMIGTTPMIGQNDVQTEVFTLTDASETVTFAQQKSIGMISMWSSNRDFKGQSGITQNDYDFAKVFNQYK